MRVRFSSLVLAGAALFATLCWSQIELNVDDPESIKKAAGVAAAKLRALYPDKEPWFVAGEFGQLKKIIGNEEGYYWWEGGAVMGALVDYWHFTGDTQYNSLVTEGLLNQVGEYKNYEPSRHTLSLGNDDQAFWGIAVLAAAERAFPDPPKKDSPQWLALAQAVFNRQTQRWEEDVCGGGLRWQVVRTNKGYDYKNTISNGLLFHMGARLARYTGNVTYAEWAEKVWDWTWGMGLISKEDYRVFDGAHVPECKVSGRIQWSYNSGVYLSGAAYMYNFTSNNPQKSLNYTSDYWQKETTSLLTATSTFFFQNPSLGAPDIMQETACETLPTSPSPQTRPPTCNTDQRSFKAYLSRFLGQTAQLAPFTHQLTSRLLRASAVAAAKSCNGPPDSRTCGLSWIKQKYDGAPYGITLGGVGEHLAALEVFQNNLVSFGARGPVEDGNGGTSKGDPNAGTKGIGEGDDGTYDDREYTVGDRVGAGVATMVVLVGLAGGSWWLGIR